MVKLNKKNKNINFEETKTELIFSQMVSIKNETKSPDIPKNKLHLTK